MARPVVLVATTNPTMAYALQERLKDVCKVLGLKLEVCPDGNESDMSGAEACTPAPKARAYDSAEALFDALEKRDPVELADTLVVLDIGTELDNAFRPAATTTDKWHVTSHRAGVAVELLMRFPQVFPVFFSPAVPVLDQELKENEDVVEPICPKTTEKDYEGKQWWGSFNRLKNEVCCKHKGKPDLDECKFLNAFQVPLHFVSPLDKGKGLCSVLHRFASGMRCWFDPTGLRTLVKNRFLGTLFGNQENWDNTWINPDEKQENGLKSGLREILLERLDYMAVAIDEEREFAMLNAYAAWKYGRRAWVVTTYDEFDKHPLWAANCNYIVLGENYRCNRDVVVLRDIDLRFPDIPTNIPTEEGNIRTNLRDIESKAWKDKLAPEWHVRAVSSHPNVLKEEKFSLLDEKNVGVKHFGQCKKDKEKEGVYWYEGLSKPIATLYQLKSLLRKEHSTLSLLETAKDMNGGGRHGAPYSNLAMAEALLLSSGRCKDHSSAHLIGALLAMEAYELLLGMSKTTALEALLALHKHEAAAEVSFPGISHTLDIKERIKDIEQTLDSLYKKTAESKDKVESEEAGKNKDKVKRIFLSQFWAELRIQYKVGEQFDAAEEANVQSMLNMSWKPKWLQSLWDKAVTVNAWPEKIRWLQWEPKWLQFEKLTALWDKAATVNAWPEKIKWLKWSWWCQLFKCGVLRTATSLTGWLVTTTSISFILVLLYGFKGWLLNKVHLDIELNGLGNFLKMWWQVITSMVKIELFVYPESLRNAAVPNPSDADFWIHIIIEIGTHILELAQLGVSYVLFGLLIAMIYRKITRA